MLNESQTGNGSDEKLAKQLDADRQTPLETSLRETSLRETNLREQREQKRETHLGVIYLNSAYHEAKVDFWPGHRGNIMLRLETLSGICASIELTDEARKYLIKEAERR